MNLEPRLIYEAKQASGFPACFNSECLVAKTGLLFVSLRPVVEPLRGVFLNYQNRQPHGRVCAAGGPGHQDTGVNILQAPS